MEIEALGTGGVLLLRPQVFGDARGWFSECWNAERYEATGLLRPLIQMNMSRSSRTVLRGLHFQEPHAQGKLVMCPQGEVFDVAVDVRRGSPTFGRWWGAVLSEENLHQLWVPEGFAHGFVVLSETCLFTYLVSEAYHPETERTLRWDDPAFGIDWPFSAPTLSVRDASAPYLAELDPALLPEYGPRD